MITHRIDDQGREIPLTEDERRKANVAIGISEEDQRFIEAIESGEIDGDCIELDEHGRRIRRRPQPASWLRRLPVLIIWCACVAV